MMNGNTLALAAFAVASITMANQVTTDASDYVELFREPVADGAGPCLLEDVYLTNLLETEAIVATIAIDRPLVLQDQGYTLAPATAEVLVTAGDTVFIAETCPNPSCAHFSQILSIELIDARLWDQPGANSEP